MNLGLCGYPKNGGGGGRGGGSGGLKAGGRSEEKPVSLILCSSSSMGDEVESATDLRSAVTSSSFDCSSVTLNIHTCHISVPLMAYHYTIVISIVVVTSQNRV